MQNKRDETIIHGRWECDCGDPGHVITLDADTTASGDDRWLAFGVHSCSGMEKWSIAKRLRWARRFLLSSLFPQYHMPHEIWWCETILRDPEQLDEMADICQRVAKIWRGHTEQEKQDNKTKEIPSSLRICPAVAPSAKEIADGSSLIDGLEKRGYPVDVAFWYRLRGMDYWLLRVAYQSVYIGGSRPIYRAAQDWLISHPDRAIDLDRVYAVSPNDSYVQTVRTHTEPEMLPVVKGFPLYFTDAPEGYGPEGWVYVYRV